MYKNFKKVIDLIHFIDFLNYFISSTFDKLSKVGDFLQKGKLLLENNFLKLVTTLGLMQFYNGE